jgi:hypothetical protein
VLYIDEENPGDLVLSRLQAMGLPYNDPAVWEGKLGYASQEGVNIHTHPELLLEQALDFEPELIVFDSQSATAIGAEEKDADSMTALYVHTFRPMASLTKACVMILHHTPHDQPRPRGSSAIIGQADYVWSVKPAETGNTHTHRFLLHKLKERRITDPPAEYEIVGLIDEDGEAEVRAVEEAM